MPYFIEDLVILGKFLILIFIIFFGVFFFIYSVSKYDCIGYGETTGLQVKFVVNKCYVNSGGKYIPYSEYMNKDVGHKIIVKQ